MNYDLLINLHKNNKRQGPGGDEQSKQALILASLMDSSKTLKIADLGCGTGASTLNLAQNLNAKIIAVDLFQDFLDVLNANAQKNGLVDKITTLRSSMEELPFEEGILDVIWAECSIYNIGFKKGIKYFKNFLKSGGILAVSEIAWLTKNRPREIQEYWEKEYPEIAMVSEKLRILEKQNFLIKGYFTLPESCWIENYYLPLENSFESFLSRYNSEDAKDIIHREKDEIALYKKYRAYYGYGFGRFQAPA
jgi:ubiquinone/menaquinone biosynthesis C-methylase UbiE